MPFRHSFINPTESGEYWKTRGVSQTVRIETGEWRRKTVCGKARSELFAECQQWGADLEKRKSGLGNLSRLNCLKDLITDCGLRPRDCNWVCWRQRQSYRS